MKMIYSFLLLIIGINIGFCQNNETFELKVAMLQILPVENQIDSNLIKAKKYIKKADSLGADLAVLPEMYSIGYSLSKFKIDDINEVKEWKKNAIDTNHFYIKELKK